MSRLIDLTQPLSNQSQTHHDFPRPLILRHYMHGDFPDAPSSSKSEIIITSNHAGTHVDSFSHFTPGPDAADIDTMPLELFCGDAVCVDIRRFPARHYVTVDEVEQVVREGGVEIRRGDIVLFCSDHYRRTGGTPRYLTEFNGISAEVVEWMANHGVKAFGVETISPDLVQVTNQYPTHKACARFGITHYENLTNLIEVVNKRFQFYGFPLLISGAAGSPVRALAVLSD